MHVRADATIGLEQGSAGGAGETGRDPGALRRLSRARAEWPLTRIDDQVGLVLPCVVSNGLRGRPTNFYSVQLPALLSCKRPHRVQVRLTAPCRVSDQRTIEEARGPTSIFETAVNAV